MAGASSSSQRHNRLRLDRAVLDGIYNFLLNLRRGAGRYEEAWRKYMEENPLPATHGRVCYHPCESACNRQFLDQPVAIHSLDRLLGDLAIEKGWTVPAGAPTGKRVLVPAPRDCPAPIICVGWGMRSRSATATRNPEG